PLWVVTGSPSAFHFGSQWSLWQLGRPNIAGFSLNVREWHPFSAPLLISSAVASGSHSIGSAIGMCRPGYEPHQSSMCQSLYARTRAAASSLSSTPANTRPENEGNEGKHMHA